MKTKIDVKPTRDLAYLSIINNKDKTLLYTVMDKESLLNLKLEVDKAIKLM